MSVESSAVQPAARAARKHSSETKEKVRAWAPVIGLRAAARKFQVNEDTACWWAHREKWVLPAVFAQTRIRNASKHAQSITHAAQEEVLREQSEPDYALHVCGQFKGILLGSADGCKAAACT